MSRHRAPSALAYLWLNHRPALLAFGLALVLVALLALRLTVVALYWADPAHADQPIEGWMTPGYAARSHGVDPEVLRTVLPPGPPGRAPGRRTLAQIAEDAGVPVEDLVAAVAAALEAADDPDAGTGSR